MQVKTAEGARAKRQQVLAPLQMICGVHPVAKWTTRHHLAALTITLRSASKQKANTQVSVGFRIYYKCHLACSTECYDSHRHMGKGREVCKSLVGKHQLNRQRRRRNGVNVTDILTEVTEKSLNKQVSTRSFLVLSYLNKWVSTRSFLVLSKLP